MERSGSHLLNMSKYRSKSNSNAFTIVELLVVIVVIGILAAITVVSYTGISQKAIVSSLQTDLNNASKLLKMDQVISSAYPATLAAANAGKGIPSSPDTTYQYVVNNNISPQSYCLSATKNSITYITTESATSAIGNCTNYLPVLYLDAGNTASYPGTGTTWNDLSGFNNNGTLMKGASFTSNNGGVIVFDGVDDYVRILNSSTVSPGSNSFSISMWFKMNAVGVNSASILINKENSYESSAGGGRFTYAWQPYWAWVDSFAVNVGDWYNAVIVYNNVNQSVYKNGVFAYSRLQTGVMGPNTNELDIGARGAGTSSFLPGTVGTVQIYQRVLSVDEISQYFNATKARYGL